MACYLRVTGRHACRGIRDTEAKYMLFGGDFVRFAMSWSCWSARVVRGSKNAMPDALLEYSFV